MFKSLDPAIRLFILVILLYTGWYILYQFVLIPGGSFDQWLTLFVTKVSVGCLKIFSDEYSYMVSTFGKVSILKNHNRLLSVNHACNGQVLYPVFIGFIIVTKGEILNKLLMILIGCVVIFSANVFRITSLVYIKLNFSKEYLDFNHKYTFVVIVYAVIFALWVFWATRFSKIRLCKANTKISA